MPKKTITKNQEKRLEEITMLIKNYRFNDGITQAELSRISELHVNTIRRLESGDRNISLLTLFSCIDALDITVSEFFEGIK